MANFIYQFVGGKYNNLELTQDEIFLLPIKGYTEDLTELRKVQKWGCHRAELDNQPLIMGYLSPMYNGTRTVEDETFTVIRYETAEVYERLSR